MNGYAEKEKFLTFPAEEFCTTIMSFGPPRSGKTFIALKCIKQWLDMGMFEQYILILPSYQNEMDDSYAWLGEYEQITIYEKFHDSELQPILEQQKKNKQLFKDGKIEYMPRVFVFIDDATSQGKAMFQSETLVTLATQNRHYAIHTWVAIHYDKGIVPPAVRLNINFVFVYPVKEKQLQAIHEQYIDFDEFNNFKKDFLPFWQQEIKTKKYGVLLVAGKDSFNSDVSDWFTDDE